MQYPVSRTEQKRNKRERPTSVTKGLKEHHEIYRLQRSHMRTMTK